MRKQLGMQLLEVMLVLAVVTSLFVVAVKHYVALTTQSNNIIAKTAIQTLMSGLERFYHEQHCQNGELYDPTGKKIVDEPLTLSQLHISKLKMPALFEKIDSRIIATDEVEKTNIDAINLRVYVLKITATLKPDANLRQQAIANRLGATALPNHQLQWQQLPNTHYAANTQATGLAAELSFGNHFWQMESSQQCAN